MKTSQTLTLIIGKRSNLSQHIAKYIPHTLLISSQNIEALFEPLNFEEEVNIIFNNFQTATKLNLLDNSLEYIEHTISSTALVLEIIKKKKLRIGKIIYTSSSSVYGNNVFCKESDTPSPLSLHASLKIANEKLIEKFCADEGIDYTIARVFNMYGGEDNFSIISKIIEAYKHKNMLSLINYGNGVRDFIYILDVVKIYEILLNKKDIKILNIGTGNGISIKKILTKLKEKHVEIAVTNIFRDELKISTSDNTKLLDVLGNYDFMDIEDFIEEKIGC